MRAKEFISEVKQAKMTKRQNRSTTGVHLFGDSEKANSDYTMFRLGMALAMSNGRDPIDIDPKSWIGKKKAAFPYTDVEAEMLKQSYKLVGADYEDVNRGDLESLELDTINKVSPVAKPKKNKYGV